jgi:hypothetical protein
LVALPYLEKAYVLAADPEFEYRRQPINNVIQAIRKTPEKFESAKDYAEKYYAGFEQAVPKAGILASIQATRGVRDPNSPVVKRRGYDFAARQLDIGGDTQLDFDSLFDQVLALTSFAHRDCADDPCRQAAYNVMLRMKGMYLLSLNKKVVRAPGGMSQDLERARATWLGAGGKPPDQGSREERKLIDSTSVLLDEKPVPPADLSQDLKPREAFVDLYRYTRLVNGKSVPGYQAIVTAWLPSRDKPEPARFLHYGDVDRVETAVAEWRNSIRSDKSTTRLEKLSILLSSRWAAILPPGITKVIVAPDGILNEFPWSILNLQGGVTVQQVVSWQHLSGIRHRRPASVSGIGLVSDVSFGAGPLTPVPGDDGVPAAASTAKISVTPLTDRAVTQEAVKSLLSRVRYAHLSTHGIYRGGSPSRESLNHSYLALSQANLGSAAARLTARQLGALDLRHLELLVLAACESGAGDVTKGQGGLGFPAAIAASGPHYALISLWRVDGPQAHHLFQTFYAKLWRPGATPSTALREAQISLRDKYPTPRDWAGWVLLGVD